MELNIGSSAEYTLLTWLELVFWGDGWEDMFKQDWLGYLNSPENRNYELPLFHLWGFILMFLKFPHLPS